MSRTPSVAATFKGGGAVFTCEAPGALGPVTVGEQRARPARGIMGGARTERDLVEVAQPA